MADGDPWSMDRIACVYEKDDGSVRRFRALEAYQAQAGLGWVAVTDPTIANMERGIKPRKALCWDAGDHSKRRAIVVATNAAYVALVPGTTTLICQNPVTDVTDTFTVYGLEGERQRGVERD